ncbi:MAG: hypothetical protein MEQ74_05070 [Paracoccus sp.]|nr:hypothetical protein [Paracoccus sp. (in: a-proteobacteria)]
MGQESKPINSAEWEAAAGILTTARDLVRDEPWGKPLTDTTLSSGGSNTMCLSVALEEAWKSQGASLVDFEYARSAVDQVIDVASLEVQSEADPLNVPYWGRSYMYWNDASERTQEDVVQALDQAIEYANGQREAALAENLFDEALVEFDISNMRNLGLIAE